MIVATTKHAGRETSASAIVYTVETLAAVLATSPKTVRRLDAAGKLPQPVRVGRGLRWSRDEIARWLAAGCPPPHRFA